MHTELVTTSAMNTGGAVTRLCAFIPNPVRPGNPPGQLKTINLYFCPSLRANTGGVSRANSFQTQFTKRVMRTFITMPSARNVNSTEDPP
jgi:hypothetical protein